ncbi:MAG TPA: hypothetical protein VHQ95_03740 [Pyrinomonadaceae bacterium]|nr:hypothetical protein [Pyrinomonadaceae bacterium]
MRDNHITEILDAKPFASLSETELATMQSHVGSCASCSRAYDAAQISALLIKERADEAAQQSLDANPFFQTRVMAAWRERRETNVSALRRLWNATGALVATMAATTAALAVLAFVAPSSETINQPTATLVPYSAESVVLDQSDNDQVTDDQVLSAIYSDDDEGR